MRMHPMAGGWLEVVCGPMFSGKSEELMRRLRRAEIARQAVAVFKPAIDDRFDATDIVSHAGLRMRGVPVRHAGDVAELAEPLDVVGIDEAQFFGPELVGVVQSLTRAGRRVVCAGLDTDYRGLPFGSMPELLAIAEFVDKLQAVCHALRHAGDDDAAAGRRRAGAVRRRHHRGRRRRAVRGALPVVPPGRHPRADGLPRAPGAAALPGLTEPPPRSAPRALSSEAIETTAEQRAHPG